MADRLPSDHESVETHRVTLSRVGGTNRPKVELPEAVDPGEETFRLVLDGAEYHARAESALDGATVIRHAADNARLAREGEGENRLTEWVEESDISLGGSAHFDVVTTGYKYGLRSPGARVVYSATDAPDSSLADIARDLGEE